MKEQKGSDCGECGMFVEHPAEYHTYAYCLLMKQLGNGEKVRDHIEYTVKNHPKFKALCEEVERMKFALEYLISSRWTPAFLADLKALVLDRQRMKDALEHYAGGNTWGCLKVADDDHNCPPNVSGSSTSSLVTATTSPGPRLVNE